MSRMSRLFVTTAFSPMMLSPQGKKIVIEEISLDDVRGILSENSNPEIDQNSRYEVVGAVGHENTAGLISELLGLDNIPELFNRISINSLGDNSTSPGDKVIAIIPNFRADKAREFSDDELAATNFRCFETRPAIL